MATKAIFATLEARPGKELEVENFLRSAESLINEEAATINWYAVKIGPLKYGIFDTFDDEQGRQLHLHGKVAEALKTHAPDLFTEAPVIEQYDILADK